MKFVADKIAQWSGATGVDEATLKMAICLFASFPLNAILKRFPDKSVFLKNVYIVTISMTYLFVICDLYSGFRTLFISTSFTYLITRYLKSDLMPILNFIFVMGHLALNHLSLQFFQDYESTKIDITGAQMVLVMKLSGFGWNVHDGRQPESELSADQKNRAVKEHPSFLNFMSYAFFYPCLLTGPSCEFNDYQQWLNSEMFSDLPESKRPGKNRKRAIPKSGRVAFYRVCQAIGWLLIWQKSADWVQMSYLFDPNFLLHNIFYKLWYLYALGFTYRLKYYAAWTISEASCIVCGLGYNGYDKETKTILWNRVQNIDIWGVESAQNIHIVLSAWNQNTNKWLKNYVYLRTVKKGKKPGFRSTLATFLTSAFWHGTRPGYYLSFATGALAQSCNRMYRRHIRPIFLEADEITPIPSKLFYDVICYVVTQVSLAYLVQPFMILDLKQSLYIWGSTYYCVHIGMAITIFAFSGPFKNQVKSFFQQYMPKQTKGSVTDIIKEKKETDQSEEMHLGIPEANFEDPDMIKKISGELEDIKNDLQKWQDEKGPEHEGENLRKAVENLTTDLEELKEAAKHELEASRAKRQKGE
jgi:lysophospholipid acyltransferase